MGLYTSGSSQFLLKLIAYLTRSCVPIDSKPRQSTHVAHIIGKSNRADFETSAAATSSGLFNIL